MRILAKVLLFGSSRLCSCDRHNGVADKKCVAMRADELESLLARGGAK